MVAATSLEQGPLARLDAVFERLAELQGQRNAIDAQIVELVDELSSDDLWGYTGARSLASCVAWKTGSTPSHARSLVAVADRAAEFPRCVAAMAAGALSLDQVAVVAQRAADGTDAHYAELAHSATVPQLRTALSLAPKPAPEDPSPVGESDRSVSRRSDDEYAYWRIKLPHVDAAVFDAALQSHLDALVAQWRRDRDHAVDGHTSPPFPTMADAFVELVTAGWDTDVTTRPHGHRTTVVLHVDVESQVGALHLGPALRDADRRFLSCDATVEAWFERAGRPIGSGREQRLVPRRLRRALEFRDRMCAVPGCGSTKGLHAHHIVHWEDGGATDLENLTLVCPFHHRLHHRGRISISGPGTAIDAEGRELDRAPVARTPAHAPPAVPPYAGPTGERADWKWYEPMAPMTGDPPSCN